jgi:RNA polymerase sigma factor (sigma-70 family)
MPDSIPDAPLLLSPEAERVSENHEELFTESFWKRTYRRAYAMVRHREDAEDIAQEACLKLLKETQLGRSIEVVGAWLFVVMRNATVQQFRSNRPDLRLPLISLIPHAHAEDEEGGPIDIPDSASPSSLERLESAEQADENSVLAKQIIEAIESLSPLERRCIVMTAYGFSMTLIAKTLKLQYSFARRNTRQATEKIRSKVETQAR